MTKLSVHQEIQSISEEKSLASSAITDVYLIYGSLRTGGIETLIVRMANHLSAMGMTVYVCCNPGGVLEAMLDGKVRVVRYADTHELIDAVSYQQGNSVSSVRHGLIVSFDPISAGRALMVEIALGKTFPVTHVSGVFHPRAYFMTGERSDRIFLNHLLARVIGKNFLFFMNEECRQSHANKWDIDLAACPILALPINYVDVIWQPSAKRGVRIVSVGRLVDFKTYNLGAAEIVRTCLERGIDVSWDIYGDGPLYDAIQESIEAAGISDRVRLVGALDYKIFSSTVARYDLFVGMGTAALEAAMTGLPTICATVDEVSCCHGYIFELPFGNVGELLDTHAAIEIADIVQNYAQAETEQLRELSAQCRAAAERYTMPKFIDVLLNFPSGMQASPPILVKRIVAALYRFATEAKFLAIIRRIRKKVRQ